MEKIPELKFTDLSQLVEEEREGIKRVSFKIKKSSIIAGDLTNQTEPVECKTCFESKAIIMDQVVNFS